MACATVTEKYALCMLKEKKRLYDNETGAYLLASMLIEMMQGGSLKITEKDKAELNGEAPEQPYGKRLYAVIKEMGKEEVSLKKLLDKTCFGISHRNFNDIVDLLKEEMVRKGLISLEDKKGIMGSKEVLVVSDDAFASVMKEIREGLLEGAELTEDVALLGALLSSNKFIKNYFTKYEKEAIKKRLGEIKGTQAAKWVKLAQDAIERASIVVYASVLAGGV